MLLITRSLSAFFNDIQENIVIPFNTKAFTFLFKYTEKENIIRRGFQQA